MKLRPVPVLYLDLDGTVRENRNGGFINKAEDVRVFPEAVTLMRRWKNDGGRIVGVTNQGGVALGFLSFQDLRANVAETQRQCHNLFDIISACLHHPEATNPEMARCWCRKPSPGALVTAAHMLGEENPFEYYPPHLALFVGDRPEDEACAKGASVDFMWADKWREGAVQ